MLQVEVVWAAQLASRSRIVLLTLRVLFLRLSFLFLDFEISAEDKRSLDVELERSLDPNLQLPTMSSGRADIPGGRSPPPETCPCPPILLG